MRAITDTWRERLAPLMLPALDGLVASGALRDDVPPIAMIRIIATTIIGYVLSSVVFRPDLAWDDEHEIDQIVRVLCDGLTPRKAPRRAKR